MKTKWIRLMTSLGVLMLIVKCNYKPPTSMYYEDQTSTLKPVITRILPEAALPGVNTIVIEGTNFSAAHDSNQVYIGGIATEVLLSSPTSLTIRRPVLTGDTLMIKLVNQEALELAVFGPYRVDPVFEQFSSAFFEGRELSALAVDDAENLYVCMRIPRNVYKITPDGSYTILGETRRSATDAAVSPDGKLIVCVNNATIYQFDPDTGEESPWIQAGIRAVTGAFDTGGLFFTAGNGTGLLVVKQDMSAATVGDYAEFDIADICVSGGSVYISGENTDADSTQTAFGIWKNTILDADGNLGESELVLDLADAGVYSESMLQDVIVGGDGTLYVATSHTDPILMIHPGGSLDVLYKGILPPDAVRFVQGNSRYVYMVQGDDWNVIRVDLGT